MKKLILLPLCFLISLTEVSAAVILKPSLMTQMAYQERINKVNFANEKKLKNLMRLAEIRSRNEAKSTGISTPPTPNTPKYTPPIPTGNTSSIAGTNTVKNVDMSRVRGAWFGWYNDYRKTLGLSAYTYDSRLDVTAHDWNITFAKEKAQNHHRRNPRDSYYDFSVIDSWFAARGMNPKVINRSKHTENVGYGYYSCTTSDCTDSLIASIRSTFNFFMSEKGKSYDAHYRSIINPYFTKMGFDIIVVPNEKRYYITVHYITE